VGQVTIKVADIVTALLLTVAADCAQQFLGVKQAQRFVIDYQLPLAGGRVFFHLEGTIAKASVDTPLEKIQGLNEMAVRVDCEHASSSSIGFSIGKTQRP
jgi:hypothetical protein